MRGGARGLLLVGFLVAALVGTAVAAPVGAGRAAAVAALHAARGGQAAAAAVVAGVAPEIVAGPDGAPLAWLFPLAPTGYVVVAADDVLPPVVAYSWRADAPVAVGPDPLRSLLRADLAARRAAAGVDAAAHPGWTGPVRAARFEQWPPAGSTPTDGWIVVRWSQGSPYNRFCPRDVAHGGVRSVAGCPAVALGQIVERLRAGGRVRFDDADDYQHAYGGNNFRFDDDHLAYGFPAWPVLNDSLAALQARWDRGGGTLSSGAATLVYAAGVAARQVYGASASGTFGVDQALMAYRRFGFRKAELVPPEAPDLQARMAANMQAAVPVHLAVVTPDWQAGHNVAVDGWNTDGFFHVNFGWGGAYDGWYLLPSGLPYGLTVLEGAIVDIMPPATAVPEAPATLALRAVPNPFNPRATIAFALPRPGRATLRVHDLAGRLVATLLDADLPAGPVEAAWDGRDAGGAAVASGVYVLRLRAEGAVAGHAFTLVR